MEIEIIVFNVGRIGKMRPSPSPPSWASAAARLASIPCVALPLPSPRPPRALFVSVTLSPFVSCLYSRCLPSSPSPDPYRSAFPSAPPSDAEFFAGNRRRTHAYTNSHTHAQTHTSAFFPIVLPLGGIDLHLPCTSPAACSSAVSSLQVRTSR